MDLVNKLELFLEVVNKGSFSRAAEAKSMDKSVFSKQIKLLETELGVRLFNRTTRSVSLTPVGEEFVSRAEQISDLLYDTKVLAKSYQDEPQGTIKILAPDNFGYLQHVVYDFMEKYPKVKVKLTFDNKPRDIITEGFDLAIRIGKLDNNRLIAKLLGDIHGELYASKSFVEKFGEPKTPEELRDFPAVVFTNGVISTDFVYILDNDGYKKRYNLSPRLTVNNGRMGLDSIRRGLGLGVVTSFSGYEIQDKELVKILPDYQISQLEDVGMYLLYPHRNQPSAVRLMNEAITESMKDRKYWYEEYFAMGKEE